MRSKERLAEVLLSVNDGLNPLEAIFLHRAGKLLQQKVCAYDEVQKTALRLADFAPVVESEHLRELADEAIHHLKNVEMTG